MVPPLLVRAGLGEPSLSGGEACAGDGWGLGSLCTTFLWCFSAVFPGFL